MKHSIRFTDIVLMIAIFLISGVKADDSRQLTATSLLTDQPLAFTENQGQWDEKVKFRANVGGATMWFSSDGAYYQFTRSVSRDEPQAGPVDPIQLLDNRMNQEPEQYETIMIKASFVGANPNPQIVGFEMMEYKCNYFIGNDPSQWRTGVPNYGAAVYQEVYPGIDLKYYGNGTQMEYDFILSPGADPSRIKIAYEGVKSLSVNESGELMVETNWGIVTELRPIVYQIDGDSRIDVVAEYVLLGENAFGFSLSEELNPELALVIDPVLSYSTFLGGSGDEAGWNQLMQPYGDIAVDAAGCAYVSGWTKSHNFPTTTGSYDQTFNGGDHDVFVTKLSADGTSIIYSTYLGGSGEDGETFWMHGIAVDQDGNAYIAGVTNSIDFPTKGAYQSSLAGWYNTFVTMLNPAGDLLYSTYLGGSGAGGASAVALDAYGMVYVAGYTGSKDFPTTPGAFQPTHPSPIDGYEMYTAKLDPTESGTASLLYSTYFGSVKEGDNVAYDIAVDNDNLVYVAGRSRTDDFPTTPGAFQTVYYGGPSGDEGVVAKFDMTKTGSASLLYSTYLGGTGDDVVYGIIADDDGNAYVAGLTNSADFPTTVGAYQVSLAGSFDGFIFKLSPDGDQMVLGTYLGGGGNDYVQDIVLGANDELVVTGATQSTDFPLYCPVQASYAGGGTVPGGGDAFITRMTPDAAGLLFSTYLGGAGDDAGWRVDVDQNDCILVLGSTFSNTDFPVTPGVYQPNHAGGISDYFVSKICGGPPVILTLLDGYNPPQPITNTAVRLYKVDQTLNEVFVEEVITDINGEVLMPDAFLPGEWIKAYKLLHTEQIPTGRPATHSPDMYSVEIDNGKFNVSTGALAYDEVTCSDQTLILDHTTVVFDLLVYLMWEAELNSDINNYFNFADGMRLTSNYLYDVSDGQARIGKVVIFDYQLRGYDWWEADVVTPDLYIQTTYHMEIGAAAGDTRYSRTQAFPPKAFGSWESTIEGLTDEFPLDLTSPIDYRQKAFALGYLAFEFGSESTDEVQYNNFYPPKHVPIYGFMESPLAAHGWRSSEMSRSAVEYLTLLDRDTYQWAYSNMGCIDKFEADFEKAYNGIYAQIYRPYERGVTEFTGPNDDPVNPTVDVGAKAVFTITDADDDGFDALVTFTPNPPRWAAVYLKLLAKSNTWWLWGHINSNGQLRILGARTGDMARVAGGAATITIPKPRLASRLSAETFEWYSAEFEITSSDPIEVEVVAVQGNFPFAHGLDFTSGTVDYSIAFSSPLAEDLTMIMAPHGESSETVVMTQTAPGMCEASFTVDPGLSGTFTLETVDDLSQPFFVINHYETYVYDDEVAVEVVYDPNAHALLDLDSLSQVGKTVMIMSTDYPPLSNGLQPDAVKIGPIFSFSLTSGSSLAGGDSLTLFYEEENIVDLGLSGAEDLLEIWQWDTEAGQWTLLETALDLAHRYVKAEITEPGAFAIFAPVTITCCGQYTEGQTGNTDCSDDGKRNLADITRLIDRVYISKVVLCCEENGNINGDIDNKLNLSDITRLIDHVYISKAETAACE